MALPLLPASAIPEQLERLRRRAVSESMRALFDYVDSTYRWHWQTQSIRGLLRHCHHFVARYGQAVTLSDGIQGIFQDAEVRGVSNIRREGVNHSSVG